MNFSTHYVQPTELDLNKAESWNFNIPGDITTGISFLENYQLSMEIAINLHLQEYASNTYEVKKGEIYMKPLDPQIYPTGHSMSSQPPDGRHVTDFAEILHTIWDMKKNLRTRR